MSVESALFYHYLFHKNQIQKTAALLLVKYQRKVIIDFSQLCMWWFTVVLGPTQFLSGVVGAFFTPSEVEQNGAGGARHES